MFKLEGVFNESLNLVPFRQTFVSERQKDILRISKLLNNWRTIGNYFEKKKMLELVGMFIQCLNLIPFRQTFLSSVIRFRNLSIINKNLDT